MTTTTPEALALATAARLAHALDPGPDGWGNRERPCSARRYNSGARMLDHEGRIVECAACSSTGYVYPLPPTLAEAQAEWAAAGGDPERGPALSGRSARVEWRVYTTGAGLAVHLRVGRVHGVRHYAWGAWHVQTAGEHGPATDIIELGRLAEAADGGAR